MRPKVKLTEMTVYAFFRELAKLGGFLGRKHDGEPGWQTGMANHLEGLPKTTPNRHWYSTRTTLK
jgi:hypothetical protein